MLIATATNLGMIPGEANRSLSGTLPVDQQRRIATLLVEVSNQGGLASSEAIAILSALPYDVDRRESVLNAIVMGGNAESLNRALSVANGQKPPTNGHSHISWYQKPSVWIVTASVLGLGALGAWALSRR